MNTELNATTIITEALNQLWDGENDNLYDRSLPTRYKYACHAVEGAASTLLGVESWGVHRDMPVVAKILCAIDLHIAPYATIFGHLVSITDPTVCLTPEYVQEKRREMLIDIMKQLDESNIK